MPEKYSSVGKKNLVTVAKSDRFNYWMYQQIFPHLHGDILEVGSGIGTFSKFIIKGFPESKIWLTDIDTELVNQLKKKYSSKATIKKLDLTKTEDISGIKVDSIFALNVIEHIDDDVLALKNLKKMLKPNGTFVMLVPAHPRLYNVLDESVDHYRRYTKKSVNSLAKKAGFKITHRIMFNMPGIFGWWLRGSLLKKVEIDEGSMGLLNTFVPLIKFVEDKIFRKKFGLSIIAVLKAK